MLLAYLWESGYEALNDEDAGHQEHEEEQTRVLY